MAVDTDNYVKINWDTQQAVFMGNFNQYRENEVLTDITLACEGSFYPVHRIILNMCSRYFAKAMKMTKGSSSVFFIAGIKKEILEAIISFIYSGSVTLKIEDLRQLAEAGKMLDIPELAQLVQQSANQQVEKIDYEKQNQEDNTSKQILDLNHAATQICDSDFTEGRKSGESPIFCSPLPKLDEFHSSDSDSYEFEGWDLDGKPNINKKMFTANGVETKNMHECHECKVKFLEKFEYLLHVTKQHGHNPGSLTCNFCNRVFKKKSFFERHVLNHIQKKNFPLNSPERVKSANNLKNKTSPTKNNAMKVEVTSIDLKNKTAHENPALTNKHLNYLPLDNVEVSDNDFEMEDSEKDPLSLDDVLKEVSAAFQNHFIEMDFSADEQFLELEEKTPMIIKVKDRKCNLCNISFSNCTDYYKHRSQFCLQQECPYCLCTFLATEKETFKLHTEFHRTQESKRYSCNLCDFTADRLRTRDDHLHRRHLNSGNFGCPICPFESTRRTDVRKHVKDVHSEEMTP